MPAAPSAELMFDLGAVLLLAEESAGATVRRTRPDFTTPDFRQIDAGPCLALARDDGVYLTSVDAHADRDPDGLLPHTYAHLLDPAKGDWQEAWDATGLPGDDWVEYLELLDSGLLKMMRHAKAEGYRWLTVLLTTDDLGIAFDVGDPPPFLGQVRG